MTTGQYKKFKGLTKQNLRDNMTNLEMTLNMLAEGTAVELSKQEDPQGFGESAGIAQRGGEVAQSYPQCSCAADRGLRIKPRYTTIRFFRRQLYDSTSWRLYY